jgi:acetyl-CoA acyltransferase
MHEAVIVEAIRTPVGRRGGFLAEVHPVDLSAHVLNALLKRTGVEPAQVDDVVWGCVTQIGDQSGNTGRFACLAAGWPESIPGSPSTGHAAPVSRQSNSRPWA